MTREHLGRLLRRDLGRIVSKTGRGTWTTTSNLPHEIRLYTESALDLVRISAGAVVGTTPSKALLVAVNELNTRRAWSRRFVVDGKVLVVAEMPVASLREGDLEQMVSAVFCTARLDAPHLASYGGRATTDPPPALAADLDEVVTCWEDVLQASRTATARELAVWLDMTTGCDCWIDRQDDHVNVVVVDGSGIGSEFPFRLSELVVAAQDLMDGLDELDELDEHV